MHNSFLIETEQEAHCFWTKVKPTESGCWEWTGARDHGGYGQLGIRGRTRRAHKIAYIWANGPVPPRLELDHLCRNRACVNPEHLEAVTRAENVRRGDSGKHLAARTHCPQGHPYSGDNLRINSQGRRGCRDCQRAQGREKARRLRQFHPDRVRAWQVAWRRRKREAASA